jgi:hypothetical protein
VQPQAAKRAAWGARRRQLEAALDNEAVTAASIDFEKATSQIFTELDRLWDMDASFEQTVETAKRELQRALDAHAAEVTAWETTRQHVEAELQEALLDAHGQRSRLAAAHESLDATGQPLKMKMA